MNISKLVMIMFEFLAGINNRKYIFLSGESKLRSINNSQNNK